MEDEEEFRTWIAGLARSEASASILVPLMVRILSRDDRVRPVVERPRMGAPLRRFQRPQDTTLEDRIRHVADWIEAAVVADEDWTQRLDPDGLPARLRTVGTLEQAEAKADKAMARALSRSGRVAETREGEEICFENDDGWTVIRMRTPAALDYESSLMQHCVGNGAYDAALAQGRMRYYSLRDPSNRPHVTLEIGDGAIRQIKGKQNRTPDDRYLVMLRDFLKEQDLFVDNNASLVLGLIRDRDQRIHNLHRLPDRLRVGGNLDLEGIKIPKLPDDLEVGGYLDVCNTGIGRLPCRLRTGSHLIVGRGAPTELPADMEIGGDLDLVGSSIAALPDGLTVPGCLKLRRCPVDRLPTGLVVGRDLDLTDSPVREIPVDARIGGEVVGAAHDLRDLRPATKAVFVEMEPGSPSATPQRTDRGPWAQFLRMLRRPLRTEGAR